MGSDSFSCKDFILASCGPFDKSQWGWASMLALNVINNVN